MPELNTIKVRQLDPEIDAHILSVVGDGFFEVFDAFLASGGFLGSNVVYTSGDQTVNGIKTFTSSPFVPYSGQSGQAISKAYVDDKDAYLQAQLTPLVGGSYVYSSGDQTISGKKTFTEIIYAPYIGRPGEAGTNFSISMADGYFLDGDGEIALSFPDRTLNGEWDADTGFTINGVLPVLVSTDQAILGQKDFQGSVLVPTATQNFNPVPYKQFKDDLNASGKRFSDLFTAATTGTISGFGGVLSFNGASGNIFTQGRGNVTVWQQGNILNISGSFPEYEGVSTAFGIQTYELPSGFDHYRISFDKTYDAAPFFLGQIAVDENKPIVSYNVYNINTSGFDISFADALTDDGYFVNFLAVDQTGLVGLLKGEQGELGPYLKPRGVWSSGTTYGYLDFVYINGVSWVSKTGHLSTTGTHPTGTVSSTYWTLLASGTGPKGENGAIFGYAGAWNAGTNYNSGEAVTYEGQSYATLSNVSLGIRPTGAPWFTIAAKGAKGDSFHYYGDYSPSTTYSGGATVSSNHGIYLLENTTGTQSGANTGPASINSLWTRLVDRSITYNGDYSATQVYYKNDLAQTTTGFNATVAAQYISTSDYPVVGLHPYGYYNLFTDCDGVTGTNLFAMTVAAKNSYHPYYNVGYTTAFKINDLAINENASGWGVLTLIRGQTYYFDSENPNLPFILTTNASGGSFAGQITGGCLTGSRLLVGPSGYSAMAAGAFVGSGTLRFTPDVSTPNTIYYQSPSGFHAGYKISVVDSNPWKVFTSGTKGDTGDAGESGAAGAAGLAFVYRGAFSAATAYVANNAVTYNGTSYYTSGSASGVYPPAAPWSVVAAKGDPGDDGVGLGHNWQGTWSSDVVYQPYDMVYYQGSSYGTSGSPSGDFPPNNFPDDWYLIAKSGKAGPTGERGAAGVTFGWRGEYSAVTNYSSGDGVYYQGSSYGTRSGVSGVAPTGAPWELLALKGGSIFSWRGTWGAGTTYNSGESVYQSGSSYATLTNSVLGQNPATGNNAWFLVAQGTQGLTGPSGAQGPRGSGGAAFAWVGSWASGENYGPNEAVFYDGSSYATTGNISGALANLTPDNLSGWFVIAQKGDPGLLFSWEDEWENDRIYPSYSAVSYDGQSFATTDYVSAGITPENAPWFLLAARAKNKYLQNFYFSTVPLGEYIGEAFVGTTSLITGFKVSLVVDVVERENLSGTIYTRTADNTRVDLASFDFAVGAVSYVSTDSFILSGQNRVGIELAGVTEGYLPDMKGLTIGIFGNEV